MRCCQLLLMWLCSMMCSCAVVLKFWGEAFKVLVKLVWIRRLFFPFPAKEKYGRLLFSGILTIMQINIIQCFQNSGVVTKLFVLKNMANFHPFALKGRRNGRSQSIPAVMPQLKKVWRKDGISNRENGPYISSLNRTWSVKTYSVKTKKNNWAISTSISAWECVNSLPGKKS